MSFTSLGILLYHSPITISPTHTDTVTTEVQTTKAVLNLPTLPSSLHTGPNTKDFLLALKPLSQQPLVSDLYWEFLFLLLLLVLCPNTVLAPNSAEN